MSIQTIELAHSPNQGRVIINSNFSEVLTELNSKIDSDGTVAMVNNFDAGGYRIINQAPGINDTDGVNKAQVNSISNKLVNRKYCYVIPTLSLSMDGDIYLDGTLDMALRAKSLTQAISLINDQTDAEDWTIKIANHPTYYAQENLAGIDDSWTIIGEGNPIIELADGTVTDYSEIVNSARYEGLTFNYADGDNLRLENGYYKDCNVYMSGTPGARALTLASVKMEGCKIIADEINLDGTTENFIDDCLTSVDLTGSGLNDSYATYKTIPRLEEYFGGKFTI